MIPSLPSTHESVALMGASEWGMDCVFSAPREDVFKAWTEAEILAQWWGPHAFTNPVCEIDVRPEGRYSLTMHSPDGTDYPLHGKWVEVVESRRLVMTMDCSGFPAAWLELVKPAGAPEDVNQPRPLRLTVRLSEVDEGTLLRLHLHFDSPALCDVFLRHGLHKCWVESFESLAALLVILGPDKSGKNISSSCP
ncbi:hypothetical protein GCM10023213_45790 [Prosthecobacter algae]|uniref:Activator of Hsp90 ATPase homologue 1/2-like C-terminal domain-containing protein n=1 Tax=Prosthecobacter algae TaxID=1144682 RepID=A0ABP9PM10_9BACT